MAGAVDVGYLSAFSSLPETIIQNLLDAPTVELVRRFLESVTTRARECDTLKSEKLRLDVELENAVRTGESRSRGLKAALDKALKESEQLRTRLDEEENARLALESELQTLKSSSSSSTSELQTLQSRISALETSNRDLLSLLEGKTTAYDGLAEELAVQHQKTTVLRRETLALEERNQAAETALMSAKFREQSLQQEIELLKKSNEWHDSELKTKNAEHSKFRKEKGARIAELQRANEDATSALESAKRTETALRNRLEDVEQKADEAFARIQQMQEDAAKTGEAFRVELDSAHRLVELQKQSADSSRKRIQELQDSLDQTKDDAAEEIGQIQAELDTERSEKEAAETRIVELEVQVERLQSEIAVSQQSLSIPSTPRRVNGVVNVASPGPQSTPGTAKGRLTFTQLYSEYTGAKADLDNQRRINSSLNAQMDEMMQELEARQPEVEEVRLDNERLESDVAEISALLETAGQERDVARKEARKWEGQVEGILREGDLLRQQLRDLSAQVKILLVEVQAREDGLDTPDAAEQAQLRRAAAGDYDERLLEGMTDTGRFISQRLVIFKNIKELQEQNQKLVRLTRELGERMEGDEAKAKQEQHAKELKELEELRRRVERYQDEMKSLVVQSQSYIRERDMFRRMLSHRGQLPPDAAHLASMFGQSVNGDNYASTPGAGGPAESVNRSPTSRDAADYGKLIKDMQSHFDTYRQETGTDRRVLKEQIDGLAKQKAELQGDIARSNSRLTLAQERFDMLQANYAMLRTENTGLLDRFQNLAENAAKQDQRTQQVAEELVEARGLADSMRYEIANLKAEKELYKKIEARLTEDNRLIIEERSRLNKVVADLQTLQNERELSDAETRRRLQSQVDALESEIQTLKRKLDKEIEDSKNLALRREYEQEQHRVRIDDLMKNLGNVREDLASARTLRDQLQARVEELKVELRNAEERGQALQPKPTPRSDIPVSEQSSATQDQQSREQELLLEVSDLKRDLQLAQAELESAHVNVDQYKAISQSAEEELQSINETQDQYKADMDGLLEEKDAQIRNLEQRVEDISSELSSRNTELSDLRSKHEDDVSKLEEKRQALQTEVAMLKDDNERYTETINFHQEDLKAQAEIAQQAQQSYENELVKHAEAAKNLQKVRSEYNQLRTEVAKHKAEAESLRTTLSQNEDSWSETKARYEQELTDLRRRREDVDAQNKLLHEQLETVSVQITSLQRDRTSGLGNADAQASAVPGMDNLQEVIKYLRREKEIVDVQYELSVNEAKRIKQQLDYTQTQLDDTRLKLDQERRNDAERERSSLSNNKLMETINELNLFRESSITLRNEARQAQAQLAERSKQVEDLLAEIQPLQTKVRDLESELEAKEGELRLLQEDRDRWQQRTQTILQKYDRVDPAELEGLKEHISQLEQERDKLADELAPLRQQVDSIPEQIRKAQEEASRQSSKTTLEKLQDQFKARSRELSAKINASIAEAQAAVQAREQLEHELTLLRQELEVVRQARDEAIAKAEARESRLQGQAKSSQEEIRDGMEDGQIDEGRPKSDTGEKKENLENQLHEAEARASEQSQKAEHLQGEADALRSRVAELERQQAELQQRLDVASSEALQNQPNPVQDDESLQQLERLRQDLATAQQEVETLRLNASAAAVNADNADNGSKSENVAEQLAALRTELEKQYDERVKQTEQTYQNRVDIMKKQLTTKLKEGKDAARQQITKEYEEATQKLNSDHELEVQRLNANHEQEMSRVKQEAEQKVEHGSQSANTGEGMATLDSSLPKGDEKPVAPAEASKPSMELSDIEARELVAKHPTIRSIVLRNIHNKLAQEKDVVAGNIRAEQEAIMVAKIEELRQEAETSKEQSVNSVKEQQEKIIAERFHEFRKKFDTMKEQAVVLEGKKYQVKLSMAQGKERIALAKLEVVEKAAKETPQKPVIEVWAIVQQTKAPPVQPKAPTLAAAPNSAQVAAVPRPMNQPQAQASHTPEGNATTHPSSPSQQQQQQQQQQSQEQQPQQQAQQQPHTNINNSPRPQHTQAAGTGPGALRGLVSQSGIPRGGPQSRGGPASRGARGGASAHQTHSPTTQAAALPHPGAATVPSYDIHSQAPQAQSQGQGMQIQGQAQAQSQGQPQSQRGSNLPRGGGGRGRGAQGRGGHQQQGNAAAGQQTPAQFHIQGQAAAQSAAASGGPTSPGGATGRGGMNAGARQFVPGKRPREDSEGGETGGKRIRGSGGGGGGRGSGAAEGGS